MKNCCIRSAFVALCLVANIVGAVSSDTDDQVNVLRTQLADNDRTARVTAARELADFGPFARDAVPELAKALSSNDFLLQNEAALALGRIGPAAATAVPALIRLLNNRSPLLQRAAAESLGEIGVAASAAQNRLTSVLNTSRESFVKVASARALIRILPGDQTFIDRALPVLVAGLKTDDESVRSQATLAFAEIGEPAIQTLSKLVGDDSPAVCWHACDALAEMGQAAADAVPALVDAVAGEHHDVCWHTARALGRIRSQPDIAVPALRELLQHHHAIVRIHSAYGLAAFGNSGAVAVNDLVKLLTDEDANVRLAAATAIGHFGVSAGSATAALDRALDDSVGAVTIAAAESLAAIGKEAVPVLVGRLDDSKMRPVAERALGDMGPLASSAVPALLKLLSNEDSQVRSEAVLALAEIGVNTAAVTDPLLKILDDADDTVRAEAAYAVVRLKMENALPQLEALLSNGESRLRITAAWGIATLAPDSSEIERAVTVLQMALMHDTGNFNREVAIALGRLGQSAKSAIPALVKLSHDTAPLLRAAACGALADIGEASPVVLKAIVHRLEDRELEVRRAAIHAVGRFGTAATDTTSILQDRLQSDDELERILAALSLVRVAPNDRSVIEASLPLLISALSFEDPHLQVEAARTLATVGAGNSDVITALEQNESDNNDEVKQAAADAIKALNDLK